MTNKILKERRGTRKIQLKGKNRKANIAFGIIIEEILETKDVPCAVDYIRITDTDLVNALLIVHDFVFQTWIIDANASFHCTPSGECFHSFSADCYLGNNHDCNIKGLGVVE